MSQVDSYAEIIPGRLYQGGEQSPPRLAQRLGDRPYLHVACAYECPPNPASADVVIHLLLDDDPQVDWCKVHGWTEGCLKVADEVRRAVQDGAPAIVTCHLGLNRSGLITAMALVLLGHHNPQQAVAAVQARRPNALCNPKFVEVIHGL